jgi:hypothetical protein
MFMGFQLTSRRAVIAIHTVGMGIIFYQCANKHRRRCIAIFCMNMVCLFPPAVINGGIAGFGVSMSLNFLQTTAVDGGVASIPVEMAFRFLQSAAVGGGNREAGILMEMSRTFLQSAAVTYGNRVTGIAVSMRLRFFQTAEVDNRFTVTATNVDMALDFFLCAGRLRQGVAVVSVRMGLIFA